MALPLHSRSVTASMSDSAPILHALQAKDTRIIRGGFRPVDPHTTPQIGRLRPVAPSQLACSQPPGMATFVATALEEGKRADDRNYQNGTIGGYCNEKGVQTLAI